MNRKLIRPTLAEVRERNEREAQHRRNAPSDPNRKRVPPEQTHAESFYYKKQMDNKTPMVIVLQDGEELRGSIEWYDRGCIKLHRTEGPNLLVLKHNIKYMYKADESDDDGDDSDEMIVRGITSDGRRRRPAPSFLDNRTCVTRASNSPNKPRVGITIGDPAGIGPEIVLKAVADMRCALLASRPYRFGSELRRQARALDLPCDYHGVFPKAS